MPLAANPPNFSLASRSHHVGGKHFVFGRMPLGSNLRKPAGQIVLGRKDLPIGTHRAAAACHPGFDLGPPFVPLVAHPPNRLVASGEHMVWRELSVSDTMPLAGQLGISGLQVVFPRHRDFPSTKGTANPAPCSGIYRSLPDMPLLAPPPDLTLASVGDVPWRYGEIFFFQPLLQQFSPAFPHAKFIKAFPHRHSP